MADDKYGPGYVYLLMRNDGWFRIGRTAKPKERFRAWRWLAKVGSYTLEPLLLVEVENQTSAEQMFHRIFADKRTTERHRGMGPWHEWFKLSRDDLLTFAKWANIVGRNAMFLKGDWNHAFPTND